MLLDERGTNPNKALLERIPPKWGGGQFDCCDAA